MGSRDVHHQDGIPGGNTPAERQGGLSLHQGSLGSPHLTPRLPNNTIHQFLLHWLGFQVFEVLLLCCVSGSRKESKRFMDARNRVPGRTDNRNGYGRKSSCLSLQSSGGVGNFLSLF